MAEITTASLLVPVSEDAPCGPDLFFEGDADFFTFEAVIEGLLPASFSEFDRGAVDIAGGIALAERISGKSKDFRVLTPLAKLFILDRNLKGFVEVVVAIASLLKERWDVAHPAYEGGSDACFRTVSLRSLDDAPHTVLPLQHAPLFKTRRFGTLTFRAHLLSEGQIKPRAGNEDGDEAEKVPSSSDVRGAINDVDVAELVAVRDDVERLNQALVDIETTYDAIGGEGILRLRGIRSGAEALYRFLDTCVASRDPTLARGVAAAQDATTAEGGDDGGGQGYAQPAGAVATMADAGSAMRAAFAYFARCEPASPTRLWLAQALMLEGKSFYDALRSLVPEHAASASMKLGRELPLSLPVERLAELLSEIPVDEPEEEPATDAEVYREEQPREESSEADDEASASSEDTGDEVAEDSSDQDWSAPAPAPPAGPKVFRARSRHEAVGLIDAAGTCIRSHDPSSPIPLLLEQAKLAAGRDFLALLRDVLPPHALRIDE